MPWFIYYLISKNIFNNSLLNIINICVSQFYIQFWTIVYIYIILTIDKIMKWFILLFCGAYIRPSVSCSVARGSWIKLFGLNSCTCCPWASFHSACEAASLSLWSRDIGSRSPNSAAALPMLGSAVAGGAKTKSQPARCYPNGTHRSLAKKTTKSEGFVVGSGYIN